MHPKAKDAGQQMVFDRIASDNLDTPYTWEIELSTLGQQVFSDEAERAEAFKTKWEELIDSGKLGYMALLRNLRNLLEVNFPGAFPENLPDFVIGRAGCESQTTSVPIPCGLP